MLLKKFLKNEPFLLPAVLDLNATDVVARPDSDTDDDNNPTKFSRWLPQYTFLITWYFIGVKLYRKGGVIIPLLLNVDIRRLKS